MFLLREDCFVSTSWLEFTGVSIAENPREVPASISAWATHPNPPQEQKRRPRLLLICLCGYHLSRPYSDDDLTSIAIKLRARLQNYHADFSLTKCSLSDSNCLCSHKDTLPCMTLINLSSVHFRFIAVTSKVVWTHVVLFDVSFKDAHSRERPELGQPPKRCRYKS